VPPDADVLVIGGGITGCAAAYYLALAGADVALVERHDLNTQASGRNAGGLHGQIQHDAFAELGEDWARSFGPALRLMRDSIELWRRLPDELGTDLEVKIGGGLVVAETDEQMRLLERKAGIDAEEGAAVELLDAAALRATAPYLSGQLVGGLLCMLEGKASPLLATPALARAAAERGARLHAHTEVLAIEPGPNGFEVETSAGRIRCGRLVACAGADTGRIVSLVGAVIPVEGFPMLVSATEPVPPLLDHLVQFAGGLLTVKQAAAGTILIGGGWRGAVDPRSSRPAVDLASLGGNLRLALEVMPALAGASLVRTWVGICPGLPDQLPVLGELPGAPGFVVSLFPYLGFTSGPLMGKLAAALALGDDPGRDLTPFSPARFR
jgi:sarcosine oxidase, subunit beta